MKTESIDAIKMNETHINTVQEPIINAPSEVKEIIERVLSLEKDKLYMRSLKNINDDILQIIKSVIQ